MKCSHANKKLLLLSLAYLFPAMLLAQGDGMIIDKIIAKVDNYIILKSDLEKTYQQLLQEGEKVGENDKCQILEQLIMNKIMMAKAEIDSVIVDEKMIEGELNRRMQYFVMQFGSQEKLEQTLGKTTTELKDELRDQIKEQMTVQKMQGEITTQIKITPSQVKRYFNKIPKDSLPFLPAEVMVGQLVKYPEVSREEKEKAREKLLEVKGRLLAGEDFASLAKQISEDYGSAAKGGDLGWHGRGELVPEFEATALRLEPGEIADPVASDFGYHLIQLLERRGNQFRAQHILVRPKSGPNDISQTERFLDSLRRIIQLDSMTFEEAVKKHSDDQETRANAGFFKDPSTESNLISTDNLDPVIFFTVDSMKVGNITKPLQFRTEDGKPAVRLIFYKAYKPPHYANLKDDYQKLYLITLNSKKGESLMDWLKTAKNDVFIDVDPEYNKCDIVKQL